MDNSSLYFITLLLCFILSAFFSAAETALTALTPAKTKQILEEGNLSNRSLYLWSKNPNRVFITILIVNNVVNTLSAAITTVMMQHYFGDYAISIATGIVTLFLLVFGEITPKLFGRYNPPWFPGIAMTLVTPFYWALYPCVSALSWLSQNLITILGLGKRSNEITPFSTHAEIAFMIRLGNQEGILAKQEGKMLENVIELGETLVQEIMIPRTDICALNIQDNYEQVLDAIKKHEHTRWPVYLENLDDIRGVLHTKDLLQVRMDPNQFQLKDYLRKPLFVPETMRLGPLLKEFRHGKAHLAIVVDEYGGTSGIVSLEDVLEEIVGEIRDEHDRIEDETAITPLEEGKKYLIDAKIPIYQLNEALRSKLPEDKTYGSLGGFLIAYYETVPPVKTEIIYDNWRFTIQKADEKRIIEVLAEPITPHET